MKDYQKPKLASILVFQYCCEKFTYLNMTLFLYVVRKWW